VTPMPADVIRSDWLPFARALPRASVDLCYVDPPFNTGVKKTATRPIRGTRASHPASYQDNWPTIDAYLAWLRERLAATIPALKATGNLLVHVDWRTSHRVRVLLDELLGADRFVNHLIWSYGLGGSCVDPAGHYFDPPRIPATSRRMRGQTKKATDVLDIPAINNMAAERTGYPTQKPLALLELLIGACSPVGGTVLDPCCGSGTTLVAAKRLGRSPLGCDMSPTAVKLARSRLASLP
jgi:site-specific DNA-methyltransferase (adenine-specific)